MKLPLLKQSKSRTQKIKKQKWFFDVCREIREFSKKRFRLPNWSLVNRVKDLEHENFRDLFVLFVFNKHKFAVAF